MIRRFRLPFALALLLVLVNSASAEVLKGKVVGITDGDTISVLCDGFVEKIRLTGIDCPEKGQAFGQRAKQFAAELAFGKMVTIQYTKVDRYGRILGDVVLPSGKILNQELIRAGYAWHYKQYSKDRTLDLLEEQARTARRGLWQDRDPVPPWEFRKQKK